MSLSYFHNCLISQCIHLVVKKKFHHRTTFSKFDQCYTVVLEKIKCKMFATTATTLTTLRQTTDKSPSGKSEKLFPFIYPVFSVH